MSTNQPDASAAAAPSSRGPRRVFAVLGMHRSGTSWLAGSLQEKGLELGEVSTRDPHNQKGNRESKALMALHDAVLAANGGSWKRPVWPNRWTPEQSAELAAFIASMDAAYPAWGFKDPRCLLVLDEWLRQVPDLVRVGIYRHPMAVHRSLHSRDPRMKESRSVEIWTAYNERLVAELKRSPFPLLRFDVPVPDLLRNLDAVSQALGLPMAAKDSTFFEFGLVHNNDTLGETVPRACRALWDELERRVVKA